MPSTTQFAPARLTMLFAALLTATLSHAVALSPRGTGQVLLYPYYTVNGGQNTILTLVNTTNRAKAIKVHFREGYNGRRVAGINLYLAPYDVWTSVVFPVADGGSAGLLTDDRSCTVPALRDSTSLPAMADGRRYLPFTSAAYVEHNADTGPSSLSRTREGSVEVIEMGEVADDSTTGRTILPISGGPADCSQLARAWASGGYWSIRPDTDITKPGGGLYGTLTVVNPDKGTIFEVAATALDGFSTYSQHSSPVNQHPDLGDARSSVLGVEPPYADADVVLESGVVHARYIGADRTVDALSAVLMASELFGEWIQVPYAGARSEWVLNLPTKRHYVDPALVSAVVLPFSERFGQTRGDMAFAPIHVDWTDDNGHRGTYSGFDFGAPDAVKPGLPFDVTVLTDGVARSPILKSLLDWRNSDTTTFPNGAISISPMVVASTASNAAGPTSRLRPAQDGTIFFGLPMIGFRVLNYVNAYSAPGVLVNYSAAVPLRSAVHCERNAAPCK